MSDIAALIRAAELCTAALAAAEQHATEQHAQAEEARAVIAAAESRYIEDPTAKAGREVTEARAVLDLAELRHKAAGARAAVARAASTAAELAVSTARARSELAAVDVHDRPALEAARDRLAILDPIFAVELVQVRAAEALAAARSALACAIQNARAQRAALAAAEQLLATRRPSGALPAALALALAHEADDEAALEDARRESARARAELVARRAELLALDPSAAEGIAAARADEAAELQMAREAAASPLALGPAVAPVIALHRLAATLSAAAEQLLGRVVKAHEEARETVGLAPLTVHNIMGTERGSRALAGAIVSAELHTGSRDAGFWQRLRARLGVERLPPNMVDSEWWDRMLAGATYSEVYREGIDRGHQLEAERRARQTSAETDPIGRARRAAHEMAHSREHGAWSAPGREAELVAIVAEALPAARAAAKAGFYILRQDLAEDRLVPAADLSPARKTAEFLLLNSAGLTLAELEALAPQDPPAEADAA